MLQHLRPAIVLLGLFVGLLGIAYPVTVTAIAEAAMPRLAGGSLIQKNGGVIGSSLIGQEFKSDRYFHGRPSATSMADPNDASKVIESPYNAANSSGSNFGPTSKKLIERVLADVKALKDEGIRTPVAADGVTSSASGLDPHISPDNAASQVARVAKARGVPAVKVSDIVISKSEGRVFGLFGEPRVNVLELNLALDAAAP